MSFYVIGHKNPDTDSVASAIAYAEFLKLRGYEAKPLIAGNINKGTALALKKFGLKVPEQAHLIDFPEASVVLVDHNESGQWADNLVKEHVVELIDHHRFGDFSSARPIRVRTYPVGSTATIVTKIFQEHDMEPDHSIAGILLSAVLTDTLMFKSPTTTEQDKKVASWLNELVGIDMVAHAQEVFAAKSDIGDMSLRDVIEKDFKEFRFNSNTKVGIAVFETVDAIGPLARKAEFVAELVRLKAEMGLNYLLFTIIDIVKQESNFIVISGEEQELLEHVFGGKAKDGIMTAPGLISRKKQIVPPLEEHFADHNHDHCHVV